MGGREREREREREIEREREYAQISEREKLQFKFLLKFSYGKMLSQYDQCGGGFKIVELVLKSLL